MKNIINLMLIVFLWSGLVKAGTIDSAGYFRVWQGFKKTGMSSSGFLSELPEFMKATVDIYKGRALNNYIVIVPPSTKPDFIPDELALVALKSKDAYDSIRATPEGQAYSAHHWDVFDKASSQSAPFVNFNLQKPEVLVSQSAYDILGEAIDWSAGYNTVFIGTRKNHLTRDEFLKNLTAHVQHAKSIMHPKGLKGYIVIANENYEIAYLNWESKEAHDSAGASPDGKAVFAEANQMMDVLMYQKANSFNAGEAVTSGEAYSTLQR
jgi:hypothetical protein